MIRTHDSSLQLLEEEVCLLITSELTHAQKAHLKDVVYVLTINIYMGCRVNYNATSRLITNLLFSKGTQIQKLENLEWEYFPRATFSRSNFIGDWKYLCSAFTRSQSVKPSAHLWCYLEQCLQQQDTYKEPNSLKRDAFQERGVWHLP